MSIYRCRKPTAWISGDISNTSRINKNDSQLLYGERFLASKEEGGFVYGQSELDGYEGAVRVDNLSSDVQPSTHRIDIPLSHIYPQPSFKTRPIMDLPLMATVTLDNETSNGFQKISGKRDGWIFGTQVTEINQYKPDYLETAHLFLHAPYLYGGQSISGIDCSGLVRIALMRAGINCPRDCDRQVNELPKKSQDPDNLKRGDIVYFDGHVVIMINPQTCINATARHMKVVIEDISVILEAYGAVKGVKNYI